jgi:hypothetical protein
MPRNTNEMHTNGMSPFAVPITIPVPVLAKALIMAGSDPYKRTFWIEVD